MDILIEEIHRLLLHLDFNNVVIDGRENFEYQGEYYILTKNDGFGYILEYAKTLDDAKMNCYEDIETYSTKLTLEQLKEAITNDLLNIVNDC